MYIQENGRTGKQKADFHNFFTKAHSMELFLFSYGFWYFHKVHDDTYELSKEKKPFEIDKCVILHETYSLTTNISFFTSTDLSKLFAGFDDLSVHAEDILISG